MRKLSSEITSSVLNGTLYSTGGAPKDFYALHVSTISGKIKYAMTFSGFCMHGRTYFIKDFKL